MGDDIRTIKTKQLEELRKAPKEYDEEAVRRLFEFETDMLNKIQKLSDFQKACFFTLLKDGLRINICTLL